VTQLKFVKEINGKEIVVEETNKNHFIILEREGFEKAKETKKTKLDKE